MNQMMSLLNRKISNSSFLSAGVRECGKQVSIIVGNIQGREKNRGPAHL